MVNRRTFLKSAGTIGSVGLVAGCIGKSGGGGGGQPFVDGSLKFLMSPTEPQDQMTEQYEPIGERLDSYIDSIDDVNMQYAANYAATLTAMDTGTADVAETGPFAAALGMDANKAEVILQRHGFGAWTYSSVIVTRKELYESGEVTSLKDLEGKKIAFADALSASGSLYPLYMLQQAGLSIPNEPGSPAGADFEPTWSGHSSAFASLQQGQADAAGVGRFITVKDADENDDGERDYKDGIREVAREKGIPRAPIMVSPKLTDKEKEQVTKAFTEAPDSIYHGADGEKGTNDDLWFDGVRKATAETYQPVVDVANELGYGEDIFK